MIVFFNQDDFDKSISTKQCPKYDLEGADLSNTDLTGANLTGADLRRADIFDSNLTWVNPKGAKLYVGEFGALACHTIMPDEKENNSDCEK